jgi:hypothetical protein
MTTRNIENRCEAVETMMAAQQSTQFVTNARFRRRS